MSQAHQLTKKMMDDSDSADSLGCCVFLRLPDLFVQVERHVTPACSKENAAFVLYITDCVNAATEPPLAVSPAARKRGVATDAPLSDLLERWGTACDVRFIPAASWAVTGGSSSSTSKQEAEAAYLRVAEQGPWALVRKVVAGEGLQLLGGGEEDGGEGQTALGERYIKLPGGVERARKLAHSLQEEVGRLLGYSLKFGVAVELEEARRAARGLLLLSRPSGGIAANVKNVRLPGVGHAEETNAQMDAATYMCRVCRACFWNPSSLSAHVDNQCCGRRDGLSHRDAASRRVDGSADRRDEMEGRVDQIPFTEVLAALRTPAAIEAFLNDIGAGAET